MMNSHHHTKLVHEGRYAAEVEVDLIGAKKRGQAEIGRLKGFRLKAGVRDSKFRTLQPSPLRPSACAPSAYLPGTS